MDQLSGALAGWRRTRTTDGIILSLQVAGSAEDMERRRLGRIDLALDERQLHSLARDLARAAGRRDMNASARKRWWTRLFSRPARKGR